MISTSADTDSYVARYSNFAEILLDFAQDVQQQKTSWRHNHMTANSIPAPKTGLSSKRSRNEWKVNRSHRSEGSPPSLAAFTRSNSMGSLLGMQTKARQQDSDQDKGELTALSGLPPLPQRPLDAGLLEYELVGGENMKDFVGTTHEDLSAQASRGTFSVDGCHRELSSAKWYGTRVSNIDHRDEIL